MPIKLLKRPFGDRLTLADDLRFIFETNQQFEYPYYMRIRVEDDQLVSSDTVVTLLGRSTLVRATGSNDGSGFVGTGASTAEVCANLVAHLTILNGGGILYDPELLRQVPGKLNEVEIGWAEDRWTGIGAVNFLTNNFNGVPQLVETFVGSIRRQAFLGFQLIYGGFALTKPQTVNASVSGDGQQDLAVSDSVFLPPGVYEIDLGEMSYTLAATTESHPLTLTVKVSDTPVAVATLTSDPATATETQTLDYGQRTFTTTGGNLQVFFSNPSPGADLSGTLGFAPVFRLNPLSQPPEFGRTKEFRYPFVSRADQQAQVIVDTRKMIQDLMALNPPPISISRPYISSPAAYYGFQVRYTESYLDDDGTTVLTIYEAGNITPGGGINNIEFPKFGVVRSVVPFDRVDISASLDLCPQGLAWLNFPSINSADSVEVRDATTDVPFRVSWVEGNISISSIFTQVGSATIPAQGPGSTIEIEIDPFRVYRTAQSASGNRAFRIQVGFAGGPTLQLPGSYSIPAGEASVEVPRLFFTLTGVDPLDTELLIFLEALGSPYEISVEENKGNIGGWFIDENAFRFTQPVAVLEEYTYFHFPLDRAYLESIWPVGDAPEYVSFQALGADDEPIGFGRRVRYRESECDCADFSIIWQALSGGWEAMLFERLDSSGLSLSGRTVDFYKPESDKWLTGDFQPPGTVAVIDNARDVLTLRSQRLPRKEEKRLREMLLSPVHYIVDSEERVLRQVYIEPTSVTIYRHGETLRLLVQVQDTDTISTQK